MPDVACSDARSRSDENMFICFSRTREGGVQRDLARVVASIVQTIVLFDVIGPSGQIIDCYDSLSRRDRRVSRATIRKNGYYLNCPWYF